MLVSCHGRRLRAAGSWLAGLSGFPLAACAEATAGPGPWASGLLAALGALALAGLAYLLGSTRSRHRHDAALRQARSDARVQAELVEGTAWQTDGRQYLLSWRGAAPDAASLQALFADAGLRAKLQAQRAFAEIRVDLAEAHEGSRSWLLRAVPHHDDLGAFVGFSGSARPTTALDAAERRAAALPALLALHSGPALLAIDDGSGWQLVQCNDAARALWPRLQDGGALAAALGPLPAAVATALGAAPAPPADAAEAQAWQLLDCGALPGGARGLVLVRRDEAPRSSQAAAEQAAANAESDSFSFTVSHDLRAPIRVVEGFTRIVKEDYGRQLDRVGNDHLDRVLGAAARMNLMIDALLTLARLSTQPLARQPVNLSQLAHFVADDLRRGTPEREIEVEIEPDLVAMGDPTLLRLVLENLLGNAWKYSGRTVKARIALITELHDNRKTYVVRDNGAGFDMRSSERLFGLFQRLHSASEFAGHGVGLASVRRIVRRHGGDVWAVAEPGRGASFYFTLAG